MATRPGVCAVAAGACLGLLFAAAAPARADKQLTVEPEYYDFGEIGPEDAREVAIRIANTGDEPIEIAAVKPSNKMGMEPLNEMKLELAPGEETHFPARIRTRYVGPFRIHYEVWDDTGEVLGRFAVQGTMLRRPRKARGVAVPDAK